MRAALEKVWKQKRPLMMALSWALIPSLLAFWIAPTFQNAELEKVIYAGGATLLFGGLLGGVLKVLLDEVVATKRRREDAAGFVYNVLTDLKIVYDRVGRARTLIPAHRSVKTYGEEMRDLIEARVQLRNVTRALERRADGIDETVRERVTLHVKLMEGYLDSLTTEFVHNYKVLSDEQRGYEERSKAILKRYAEDSADAEPPQLPGFVWEKLCGLPRLADFIGNGHEYKDGFEKSLDDASNDLRKEHARILAYREKRRKNLASEA